MKNDVAIFVRSLEGVAGGLEKAVCGLANNLSSNGHRVFLITLDNIDARPFFKLDSRVIWIKIQLGMSTQKATNLIRFKRMLAIRKIVKKKGIRKVISFQSGMTSLVAISLLFARVEIIAAERESLTRYNYINKPFRKKVLHFTSLLFVDKIQVFFESYISQYPYLLRRKCVVIPNYLDFFSKISAKKRNAKIEILYIGRLEYPKNLSILVKAAIECNEFVNLTIIGEGSELLELQEISNKQSNIRFVPKTLELELFWRNTDYLCLISLWEGFPNAALEALSRGVPVIGFSRTDGVSNLITNYQNGLLSADKITVESVKTLLKVALETKFEQAIVQESVSMYLKERVLPIWETVLQ